MVVSMARVSRGWGMTARKAPATIDRATLEAALEGLRFNRETNEIPDVILDALNAALDAYVRGRRDLTTLRETLIASTPAIARAIEDQVRDELRDSIQTWSKNLRKVHATANPTPVQRGDADNWSTYLRVDRAVWRWLFQKGRRRTPIDSRRRPA